MHEGGCHCGNIRYRVTGNPVARVICNCNSCRKTSGAQSVGYFMVTDDAFRWTRGRPETYASSEGVTRGFCKTCGTSLSFAADYLGGMIDITIATLDDPGAFPPTAHVNDADAIDWARHQDSLPRFERFPE
ncbi:MAG: GFA family protein [Pacificimonas sp.]